MNPLWKFVENFDDRPPEFSIENSARGSSANTHYVAISPEIVLVESTNTPVYTNTFDIRSPAISYKSPDGFFGRGSPTMPGGLTFSQWAAANLQWRFQDISPLFYNVIGVWETWQDLGYVIIPMDYMGGGYAPYTIQFRDKNTGVILVSGTFSLTAA